MSYWLHKTIDDPTLLEHFASAYALRDWLDWILDNPVNTRDFDFDLINYNKKDRRAEFTKYPGRIHPLPTWEREEEEELEKKLRKKVYSLGVALTQDERNAQLAELLANDKSLTKKRSVQEWVEILRKTELETKQGDKISRKRKGVNQNER
ncbi:MAG: hypothetical protein Q8O05_06750 [Chloroflexota bacterium]|nr:hypothetical protein [Chloroflexota bacterium]